MIQKKKQKIEVVKQNAGVGKLEDRKNEKLGDKRSRSLGDRRSGQLKDKIGNLQDRSIERWES